MNDVHDFPNASPTGEIRHGVRQLARDVVTLVELQAELLEVDVRDWLRQSVMPMLIFGVVAAVMGLAHPDRVRCELPGRPADGPPLANGVLVLAERAVREAVPLAARHAAAVRAATVVSREATLTRHRLRALEHRRIPDLRGALLRALTQAEELESTDAIVRRWASPQRKL